MRKKKRYSLVRVLSKFCGCILIGESIVVVLIPQYPDLWVGRYQKSVIVRQGQSTVTLWEQKIVSELGNGHGMI